MRRLHMRVSANAAFCFVVMRACITPAAIMALHVVHRPRLVVRTKLAQPDARSRTRMGLGEDRTKRELSTIARVQWAPHVRELLDELSYSPRMAPSVKFLLEDVCSPVQMIRDPFLERLGVELMLKRDDLIHPQISGNKWRKLKYNVLFAAAHSEAILTFGGAFSNHIAATAAAGAASGIRTVGVIRGEELKQQPLNPTLQTAQDNGMHLHFVTREAYRELTTAATHVLSSTIPQTIPHTPTAQRSGRFSYKSIVVEGRNTHIKERPFSYHYSQWQCRRASSGTRGVVRALPYRARGRV
jgi:hypothetical protein